MFGLSVVFTSTVEFLTIAMYMGGDPLAAHDNWKPGNACTTGAASGNIIFGAVEMHDTIIDHCFTYVFVPDK